MNNQGPNLIFVFADEWRQQAIGFREQDPVVTPNLDAFSQQSLVLTQAVSCCPICSPYRGMLFTGKYPISSGVITNSYSETIPFDIELKDDQVCLTDVLHDAGYHQGYIGKLHLHLPKEEETPFTEGWRGEPGNGGTFWDAYTPPGPGRHGIDFWYSYGCCDQHLTPHYWTGDAAVDERIDIEEWSVKHETDVAIDYVRNRDDNIRDPKKPFALFVSYNPPHMPFDQVPSEYLKAYEGTSAEELLNRPNVTLDSSHTAYHDVKNYFAAITGVDEQFGRILATLEAEGLVEDTIIIFTSDHGEMMGSHGMMGKGVWYDESLRVPFLIRWPQHITPGSDDLLFNAPDIMPSLLGLMGLDEAIPSDVEGANYAAALLGRPCDRPTSALYFFTAPQFHDSQERRGIRTDRYTFVVKRHEDGDEFILHDNVDDPYQLKNVAGQTPHVIQALSNELNQWLQKTNDPWQPVA